MVSRCVSPANSPKVKRLRQAAWCGLLFGFACSSAPAQTLAPTRHPAPTLVPVAAAAAEPQSLPEDLPGLDVNDISPVVMARYGAVGGCHTIQYSGGPAAPGAVTVEWLIQPDGSVGAAEVAESSFTEQQFHDCLLAVARRMQFPPAPGTTPVTWKFRFAAKVASVSNARASYRQ